MVHVLTLRAPGAGGTFRGIETPKLPSAYSLIRAGDIPGENHLSDFLLPILARDHFSYPGEPAALLAGPDSGTLEKIADSCRVLAEPGEQADPAGHRLVRKIALGKEPGGAASAWVRQVYRTGMEEHWYPETLGAVCIPDGGGYTIRTATQWPYHVKRSVALVLGLREEQIRVQPTEVGPSLDGKIWYPSLLACQAALVSRVTGKPAKLMLRRDEDYRYSPKRCAAEIRIETALGENQEVLGNRIQVSVDLGTGAVFGEEILDRVSLGSLGAYRTGRLNLEAQGVEGAIPPQGPLAGFGLSQGFFAAERQASIIADTLEMDPADWRKGAFLTSGEGLAIGVSPREVFRHRGVLDAAAALSGYHRKWASYELLRRSRQGKPWRMQEPAPRGIGITCAYQGSGLLYPGPDQGNYGVEVTLEKDGSLEIRGSLGSQESLWRNIAQEILGIEPSHVRINPEAPDSGPAVLSRNISIFSRLVEQCCQAVRKLRFRDPLPITVSRKTRVDRLKPWGLEGGTPADQGAFSHLAWASGVVELEIDPVSYVPRIRGIWLAVDGGRILHPAKALRSLKTGVIAAFAWASRDQPSYREGLISPDFPGYLGIPAAADIPRIEVHLIPNEQAAPKGIGELPFHCIPAAFVQAVSQAVDHPFTKIPLTPRDVWETQTRGADSTGERP